LARVLRELSKSAAARQKSTWNRALAAPPGHPMSHFETQWNFRPPLQNAYFWLMYRELRACVAAGNLEWRRYL
jgi:hypothetical protein